MSPKRPPTRRGKMPSLACFIAGRGPASLGLMLPWTPSRENRDLLGRANLRQRNCGWTKAAGYFPRPPPRFNETLHRSRGRVDGGLEDRDRSHGPDPSSLLGRAAREPSPSPPPRATDRPHAGESSPCPPGWPPAKSSHPRYSRRRCGGRFAIPMRTSRQVRHMATKRDRKGESRLCRRARWF